MNRTRRTPRKARQLAFDRQGHCCYYCKQPMWTDDPAEFSQRFNIKESQTRLLQLTAEHLHPWKDGGSNSQQNIVAACRYCNQRLHNRRKELDPLTFRIHVQRGLRVGRWHGLVLVQRQV